MRKLRIAIQRFAQIDVRKIVERFRRILAADFNRNVIIFVKIDAGSLTVATKQACFFGRISWRDATRIRTTSKMSTTN